MLNKRVFNALPIQIQSILCPTTIVSRHATLTTDGWDTRYTVGSTNDIINGDYISIPSYVELTGDTTKVYGRAEAHSKLPWINAANSTVYEYNNGSFTLTTSNAKYLTARFKGVPISYNPKVFKMSNHGGLNIYNTITSNYTLNSGDIFEYEGNLYLYATKAQVDAGAPIILASSDNPFYCSTGGWVLSAPWWTRSAANDQNTRPNFIYAGSDGSVILTSTLTQTHAIDYSIGF